MEFEATSRRKFQVAEFYHHFKSCLPKLAMVSQGVRGSSSKETFEQGEVIVITEKSSELVSTGLHASNKFVEGHYIFEGDVIQEPIYLPLNMPALLITEVTGIKGQSKEQWKTFQQSVKCQFLGNDNTIEREGSDDEYERFVDVVDVPTRKSKGKPNFFSKTIGRIKKLAEDASPFTKKMEGCLSRVFHSTPADKQGISSDTLKPLRYVRSISLKDEILKSGSIKSGHDNENPDPQNAASCVSRERLQLEKSKSLQRGANSVGQKHLSENDIKWHNKMVVRTESSDFDKENKVYSKEKHLYKNMILKDTSREDVKEAQKSGEEYVNCSDWVAGQYYENHYHLKADLKEYSKEISNTQVPCYNIHQDIHASQASGQASASSDLTTTCEKSVESSKLTDVDVKRLTIQNVGYYLKLLHLQDYVETFAENQVDGALLLNLNDEILTTDFKMSESDAAILKQFASEGRIPVSRESVAVSKT